MKFKITKMELPKGGYGDENCSISADAVLGEVPADDLKCCGNCDHRGTMDNGDDYSEWCAKRNNMSSWGYCDKWESDRLTRKDRTAGISL